MGFTANAYLPKASSSSWITSSGGNTPSYSIPQLSGAPGGSISINKFTTSAAPTYQAPGALVMPEFTSPTLKSYIKDFEIPGVSITAPEIDKGFIREQTQELASPAIAEERMGLQTALQEARRYSDNPAVVSKILREMMAARGTGLSKILGSAGQTASQMEAGNRAQKLNVDTNNANLAQSRNMAAAQAEFETANKQISEENARMYGEKQDYYQKAISDLLNQRNASSSFNNNAALQGWQMENQNQLSGAMAEYQAANAAQMAKAGFDASAKLASYEDQLKRGLNIGAPMVGASGW